MFSGCFHARATYLRRSAVTTVHGNTCQNSRIGRSLTWCDCLLQLLVLCCFWTRLMCMPTSFQLSKVNSLCLLVIDRYLHLSHLTTAFKMSPTWPPELRYVTVILLRTFHVFTVIDTNHSDQSIRQWHIALLKLPPRILPDQLFNWSVVNHSF